MPKRSLPLAQVYRLLEPGPVVLLSTTGKNGFNVMPMSWHLMMEFTPPLVGCIVSNRNFSFAALKSTKECVLNIPTRKLALHVAACGNTSGRRVDKFDAFKLTPLPASQVRAPLVAECYANLECRVVDTRNVSRYCFFVLEVVKAWIDRSKKRPRTLHHMGRGSFMVAGDILKLPSRAK